MKELRASFSSPGFPANRHVGLEGEHLLQEALRSGLRVVTIFFRSGEERRLDGLELNPQTEVIELPEDIFASAVTTESPQGIAALVEPEAFSLKAVAQRERPLVVIAAGLQDPGNLGTLVRSAEAFGASGVITLPGTVSPWNAKALRASSGSAFRLPVVAAGEDEAFAFLQQQDIPVLAATVDFGTPAADVDFRRASALLIGNEGSGLSRAMLARAIGRVTIPCPGPVESLNAAIAASILLYEAARQRSQ